MRKTVLLLSAALLLVHLPPAQAGPVHAFLWKKGSGMIDLGTLGADCYAMGVNDREEVVGWFSSLDFTTLHAFYWTAATGMIDLGTLPGGLNSEAWAINSSGEVAGEATDSHGKQLAVAWSASTGFVPLRKGDSESQAAGLSINDSGAITGVIRSHKVVRTFYWQPAAEKAHLIALRPAPLSLEGASINNKGDIAGTVFVERGNKAFVWSRKTGAFIIPRLPHSISMYGAAINDSGEVVGSGGTSQTGTFAFYWKRGLGPMVLQSLGGSYNEASAINSGGVVVGTSSLAPYEDPRAVIWSDPASPPVDLGTLPGGVQSYGLAINSAGDVVGGSDSSSP